MPYNIKLEIEIQKLGFKRKWFLDKSGYWFEKDVKFKDFKLKFTIESDNKLFLLSSQNYYFYNNKMNKSNGYDDIAKFKCDLTTIKKVLKKYK